LQALIDANVPTLTVGDQSVPLAGFGTRYVWALVNLIFGAAGGLLTVILVVRALLRRRREQTAAETPYSTAAEKERKARRLAWLVLSLGMGIAGVILFLLTENMAHLMVLVDKWTVVSAAILAAEVVGYVFAFKHEKTGGGKKRIRRVDTEKIIREARTV
jgi:uncharacterized membrane protein